jgi:hypothetical protein
VSDVTGAAAVSTDAGDCSGEALASDVTSGVVDGDSTDAESELLDSSLRPAIAPANDSICLFFLCGPSVAGATAAYRQRRDQNKKGRPMSRYARVHRTAPCCLIPLSCGCPREGRCQRVISPLEPQVKTLRSSSLGRTSFYTGTRS